MEFEEPQDAFNEYLQRSVLSRKTVAFWDGFFSWLFSFPSRSYLRDALFRNEKGSIPLYSDFAQKYSRYGSDHGIICCVTDLHEDLERINTVLAKLPSRFEPGVSIELAAAELFGKGVAYRSLKEGDIALYPDEKGQMVEFTVDRVFSLWKDVRAFGLVAKEEPPILLFRGTDLTVLSSSGRASMISDLDPKGPGFSAFNHSKDILKEWLSTFDGNARAIGHSLGGVFVVYALEALPEYFSKSRISVATNYPGVSRTIYENWESMDEKPRFLGVVTDGDIVSKYGLLLPNTYVWSIENELAPLKAHEHLIGSEQEFSLYEVDVEKENASPSRKKCTTFHEKSSKALYEIGLKRILPEA